MTHNLDLIDTPICITELFIAVYLGFVFTWSEKSLVDRG
jgi:hypothetical protein